MKYLIILLIMSCSLYATEPVRKINSLKDEDKNKNMINDNFRDIAVNKLDKSQTDLYYIPKDMSKSSFTVASIIVSTLTINAMNGLPTTAPRYTFIFNTSDMSLYLSTETIAGKQSWKKISP
jgi:hypothetical protein